MQEQDAWMGREEAESALAGMIGTFLAGGRIDKQRLNESRALVDQFCTRAPKEAVAVAFRILSESP